jgi:hypothetical protein
LTAPPFIASGATYRSPKSLVVRLSGFENDVSPPLTQGKSIPRIECLSLMELFRSATHRVRAVEPQRRSVRSPPGFRSRLDTAAHRPDVTLYGANCSSKTGKLGE